MAIQINGNGTITGISVGGLPDGIVDTDMLAAGAATGTKLALPSGSVIQTVTRTVGDFNLDGNNNGVYSGTPETIIDGCQTEIQITESGSKILVMIGGFCVMAQRAGPAEFAGTIGFADSSSSGVNFAASDYSTVASELCTGRKNWSSNGLESGESGCSMSSIYMAHLHTHGQAVGKYLYYTAMFKDDYNGANSGSYYVKGNGTVTLMEIAA